MIVVRAGLTFKPHEISGNGFVEGSLRKLKAHRAECTPKARAPTLDAFTTHP